jgi:hypothetical protein
MARAEVSDSGEVFDYIWKDSVREAVSLRTLNGAQEGAASRSRLASRHSGRCEPWIRGLLVLNIPNTIDFIPFEQLVQAGRFRNAERRRDGDREMVLIELAFDPPDDKSSTTWVVEVYFDPNANYLIRKTVYQGSGTRTTIRRIEEVLEFEEFASGLYFPKRIVGENSTDRGNHGKTTAVVSDIRLNQPVPESTFRLQYPNGIFMSDMIRGVRYRIDANGKAITKEEAIEKTLLPPGVSDSTGTETQQEPRSLTRLILPIGLGVFALGAVIVIFKRIRYRNAANESK